MLLFVLFFYILLMRCLWREEKGATYQNIKEGRRKGKMRTQQRQGQEADDDREQMKNWNGQGQARDKDIKREG